MQRRMRLVAGAVMLLVSTTSCSAPDSAICPEVHYAPVIVINDVDHVLPASVTVRGTVCSGATCTRIREQPSTSPPVSVSYDSTELTDDVETIDYDLTAEDEAGTVARRMTGATTVMRVFPHGTECAARATSTIRP